LLSCAAAAAGCGLGPGEDEGEVELTVTRDFGGEELISESDEISETDTVLRVLDRNADVETSFGGGFVQSVDGLAGGSEDGRRSDWFFYVNGVESSRGSADFSLGDGDRVWWDHHDWSTAMRAPAVVGSWPEPFVHGFEGTGYATEVVCRGAEGLCSEVRLQLEEAGATLTGEVEAAAREEARVVVGPWDAVRSDPVAGLLRGGPQRSGVYATFAGSAPSTGLVLLDQRGRVAETLGIGSGLVAALRPGEDPPTWVITGTDAPGTAAAADLLGEPLAHRFALATVENGPEIPVPVP
jgi:hypothetical protein